MAIAFVQSTYQGFNNSTSVRTLAFSSNVTAGNYLVIAISTFASIAPTLSFLTVSDSQGNPYEQITVYPPQQTGTTRVHIYVVRNAAAGATTVSVDPNGNSVYMGLAIHEYSGVDKVTPVESWSSRHQTSVTSATAGEVYTNNSGVAVFAAFTQPAGTVAGTAGTGFTKRADQPNSSTAMTIFTEDKLGCSGDTDTPFTFASAVTSTGVAFGMLPTVTPTATIQMVQSNYFEYVSSTVSTFTSSAQTVAYTVNTTTGNLLVCGVATCNASGALTTTVTDDQGNVWSEITAKSATGGTGQMRVAIWQAHCTTGGATTVTITPDAAVYVSAVIMEFSGSDGVLATSADASGTDTAPSSGNFTTIANGLTVAVMGENVTLGAASTFQNTIGYESGWSNKIGLPGLSQQSMGMSVITFGDITNDAGATRAATWKFLDSASWVVTAAVLQPNSVLAIAGTSTATFTGQASIPAELDIAGTATVAFAGASGTQGVLAVAGTATVAFTSTSTAESALAVAGTSTVTFVGASTAQDEGVLEVNGTSTVTFVAAPTAESVLDIAGTSTVDFVGEGAGTVVGGWRQFAFKGPIIIPPPVLGGTPMRFLKRRFARGWRRKLGRFGM